MRRAFSLALVFLGFAAFAAPQPFWSPWTLNGGGGEFKVESVDRESFFIRGKRTDKSVVKPGCIAIGTLNQETWTNTRLAMSVRSTNGRKVSVTVSLSFRNGTNSVAKSMNGFDVSGKGWREMSWSLDHDFGLGDGSVKVCQAKIIAWIGSWASGEEGGIEVKNFRICNATDVVKSDLWIKGDRVVNVPFEPRQKPTYAADALKVFFAFDNEDIVPHPIKNWKGETDLPQYGGFREVLLEHTDGRARYVADLDEADVIVCTRCRPDPALATNIVRAVRERGVPLYAATEVRDPEIAALLPCRIGQDELEDLPRRERVKAALPSALGHDLNDAAFGIYRTCEAKDGARTLLRFEGGTPALVEGTSGKGKVLYSMLAIGSSLVPGKESPDAFFVRALGYLSGRSLPERPRAPARVSKDGWRVGAGKGDFGHFGWNRSSELPIENLSGRFGVSKGESWYEMHVPRTEAGKPRTFTYASRNVDQLAYGGDVAIDGKKAFRVDASLAYPGIRWDIEGKTIEMRMRNQLSCVYVPMLGGGKTVDYSVSSEAIDARKMTEPWILVYNGSFRDSPLAIVFQHRLDRIEVIKSGESIEGLRFIAAGKRLGVITPTRIYGSLAVDTTQWTEGVPAEARRLIGTWRPRALRFPCNVSEAFRINEAEGRVEMKDFFSYLSYEDDWGTKAEAYAALPPVATLLAGRGTASGAEIVRPGPGAENSGLVTKAGDLYVRAGANTVDWSVALHKPDLSFLPHVIGREDVDRAINAEFAEGVQYSSGGTRMDHAGQKFGKIGSSGTHQLNMHGLLLGMSRCLPNPYIFTEEHRRLMRRRLAWRMFEPLEVMPYKMAVSWREEPFSGSRYTIYMNSPRRMANEFDPPEYGSRTIYGDSNETVRMMLHAIQVGADRFGQQGVVRANWDTISRHIASYHLVIDDWGILASGCLELGGGGTIDMLNGEFGCMMSFARLAEIAGDGDMRALALYKAARRLCPTLARQRALAYFREKGLFEDPDSWRMSVGFGENGAAFHHAGRAIMDVELFDMSQGIPQDLVSLYEWYGWDEMRRDYLSYVAKATPKTGLNWIMLSTLAIGGGVTDAELKERLDLLTERSLKRTWHWHDWPGMDGGSAVEYALHRLYGSPYVTDCRDVFVHDATYDPRTKTVKLDFTPGANAALAVGGKPVEIKGTSRQTVEVSQ